MWPERIPTISQEIEIPGLKEIAAGLHTTDTVYTLADAMVRIAEAIRHNADKTYAAATILQAAIDRNAMAVKEARGG